MVRNLIVASMALVGIVFCVVVGRAITRRIQNHGGQEHFTTAAEAAVDRHVPLKPEARSRMSSERVTTVPQADNVMAGVAAAVAKITDTQPPEVTRDSLIEGLRSSGIGHEQWVADVRSKLKDWWNSASAETRTVVQISETDCYRAGCYTTITYRDGSAMDRLAHEVKIAATEWKGPQIQVGPEILASGSVRETWFHLRPDK